MPDATRQQQAWGALRSSRLTFSSSADGGQPLLPGNLTQLIERDARRKRSNLTGYRPAAAATALAGEGMPRQDAESAVRRAILDNFPRFANSWDRYIDDDGYLLDLLLLPEADKELLVAHEALGRLRELSERSGGSAMSFIADTSMTVELARLAELNARRDETHPAYALMVRVHGLHPELTRAVLLHAKVVPWWAYAILAFLTFLGGMTFLLALFAPHSSVFENESVGGVNFMHYTLLPLVTIGLGAALWWLIRNRRRFESAWRDQLARYARETGEAGG